MSAAILIPRENVEQVWPLVEPFVKRVCARHADELSEGGVLEDACQGLKQIWLAWDEASQTVQAVVCTTIEEALDGTRTARILFCTGQEREAWQDLIGDVIAWAGQNHCKRFKAMARKGWSRHLAGFGFKPTHVMFEKELH